MSPQCQHYPFNLYQRHTTIYVLRTYIVVCLGCQAQARHGIAVNFDLSPCPERVRRHGTAIHWRSLHDDELLDAAERNGFTTLITTDKRMAAEQPHVPIAIIAVDNNSLAGLRAATSRIADAVRSTPPGENRVVPVARVRR